METKEAIIRIKRHNEIHAAKEYTFAIYITEALNMAVEALEKQIPKTPIIWEDKYYYSPTPNDDWGYECPCCGNRDIDYPEHHCICGQTLWWDDINT